MPISAPSGYHYENGQLVADVQTARGPGQSVLAYRGRNALDLQRAAFPEGQPEGYQLNRQGEVEKQPGIALPMALTLAAPFLAGFGPAIGSALGGLGGGGGAAAAALPGASAAPSLGSLLGAAPGGGGMLGGLLGQLGGVKGIAGLAGKGLGAFAQGQATNRGAQFGGQLDLERLMLDRERQDQNLRVSREQEGRAGSTDAWRKLLAAQYAQGRGQQPHLSPYSVAPRDLSGLGAGSDALMQEVMGRLQGGNPIPQVANRPMAADPSLLKAGGFEKTAGALSPLLTLFGGGPAPKGGGELEALRALLGGR